MDSVYLFLTCVKNNAIGLIKREFLNDKNWYLSNSLKIHPSAIYICLLLGHTDLLRELLKSLPNYDFKNQLGHMFYAIDVALMRGHYDTVIKFLEHINK